MLMNYGVHSNAGVRKESFADDPQIMVNSAPHFAVGVVVSQDAGEDDGAGRKIVKAGTPLYGDLDDRETPFKKTGEGAPAGILQHTCDVTFADGNGDLVLIGVVNLDRVDEAVQSLITDEVKKALQTIKMIHFD